MSADKRKNQDRSAETRARASGMSTKPRFEDCCDPRELLDLTGRRGLVIGIANERSPAWPGALHFRQAGADLAITFVGERARPHVAPLADRVDAPIFLPCDAKANSKPYSARYAIPGGVSTSFSTPWERPDPRTCVAG